MNRVNSKKLEEGVSENQYNYMLRILHWVIGTLIIFMLCHGFWMSGLPNDFPSKYTMIYSMHKSFGVLIFTLVLWRLIVRLSNQSPRLPSSINKFDSTISLITILLLYISMLAMPISGYLISAFGNHPISFFGLFNLPLMTPEDHSASQLFSKIHGYIAYIFSGIIILHVLGFFKHCIVERVNLLKRIG